MALPFQLAVRYIKSKKRAFVSVGTLFATLGVLLGVAALTTVMSVTGGFLKEFQDKVLGVNADVLVLKYSSDFREYREVMKKVETIPGVTGVAPFVINPMMVTHGTHTATGVLLKGVDPARVASVLDLPSHIVQGSLKGLRPAGSEPPKRHNDPFAILSPSPHASANSATIVGNPPKSGATASAAASVAPLPHGHSRKLPPAPGHVGVLEGMDLAVPMPSVSGGVASPPGSAQRSSTQKKSTETPLEGEVEPEGGYTSQLPDEDIIPDDLVADPCKSPDAVKKMPGIVIGKTLRENLGVNLGDCVQVTSPTIGFSYSGGVIRAPVARQFRVIAVFDAGFDQYDSKLVYTDLYQAQAFYDTGDSVTGVEMKIANVDDAKKIAHEIERRLDNGIYHTMDWEELNHGLFTALRIQKILISLVLALIIIVAAFTVIATLIMVVLEKTREIAVLKAMGATDSALLRVFLYQGAFIGLVGTVAGLVVGWITCQLLIRYQFPLDPGVYFISRLPVRIQADEFLLVGGFALVVCMIATSWPALYAARLRPAEAFRSNH